MVGMGWRFGYYRRDMGNVGFLQGLDGKPVSEIADTIDRTYGGF